MLYERWRRIIATHRDQLALSELATGRRWTFGELSQAAEAVPPTGASIVFPQGNSAEFILSVLRAWRSKAVLCPLEPGQPAPVITGHLPRSVVHLKTTSATTGTPRLVAFTDKQLLADAENIIETMGLRKEWPNIGVISLAHSYGFSNLVLPLLLQGIPLLLANGALPETLRRAAAMQPALTLAGVPALWQTWHESDAIPSNILLAISAGAPLPLALERAVFESRGIKIHNFYGSSECGGIAYDATNWPRDDAVRVGTPMRNVQVSVAKDGCIEVRGAAVAESYWPERSPNLGHGVFHTSDLGELIEGAVYLRGRAGDRINVAGRKVLPETIERVLEQHPEVRGCLAFGVPSSHSHRGEMIVACVAGCTHPERLKQFALTHLPAWQVPRRWWLVDSLAANGRGKLSRAEWRKKYLEKNPKPENRKPKETRNPKPEKQPQ